MPAAMIYLSLASNEVVPVTLNSIQGPVIAGPAIPVIAGPDPESRHDGSRKSEVLLFVWECVSLHDNTHLQL